MEGRLLLPPSNNVLSFLFQVSKVPAVPKMMGRVPRCLGVVSKVLLAVPKPLSAVPTLLREMPRWLGVVPKVYLRAMLVVEGSAHIAADSGQNFECHA